MELNATAESRFWAKIAFAGPDDCWEWTACRQSDGYGNLRMNESTVLAHRLAWFFTFGQIPDGMYVLHKCDNPPCVNPSHLFLGSLSDNAKDMYAKGRGGRVGAPSGEASLFARLTEKEVREIRRLYEAGGIHQYELGRQFGVAQSAISLIINRKRWKHV